MATKNHADVAAENRSYNSGKFDGFNAAFMNNPPHLSWSRDKEGRLTHFNKPYLSGYKVGYFDAIGERLY